VSRAWPDWGAVFCCWIAKCQSRWPQCWRWHPRWNRLASSTSYFGSSACLQSSSSVLCRTMYGLESPQGTCVLVTTPNLQSRACGIDSQMYQSTTTSQLWLCFCYKAASLVTLCGWSSGVTQVYTFTSPRILEGRWAVSLHCAVHR